MGFHFEFPSYFFTEGLTMNAILDLKGDDCIKDLTLVSTENGAELATKRTNSDIVAEWEHDRIVLEFQHEGDEYYKDRLVYYIARQPGRQQPPCAVAARDRCHQQRGKRRFQRQNLQALAKRRKIE